MSSGAIQEHDQQGPGTQPPCRHSDGPRHREQEAGGAGPLLTAPLTTMHDPAQAPSALQGFSCWAHFSPFCPDRGSRDQGGGCLNGWSPPRNASPGDGRQAGLRAWTPSPGGAPRPQVAHILGGSSDTGLLPGRQCIQPGPALQGVGRVSPKCRGGSWPAALKAPWCSLQGGRMLGVGVPSVQKHLWPDQPMFFLSLPRSP